MHHTFPRLILLILAALPCCYYLLGVFSAWHFFQPKPTLEPGHSPPVSILKPVRGLDREAYANFASFCTLDYPEYEILFGVAEAGDPAIPVIERIIRDFPQRKIRLLVGEDPAGTNRKTNKLCRLAREARYDLLVINDSDVRVRPDYLRAVAAPFRAPDVGAVTCLFTGMADGDLGSRLEAVGNASEFLAGVLTAWQLEGVEFTLGATMATTRERLAEIGGFEAFADYHADDYELGRRIAAQGWRVELLPYTVALVYPSQTVGAYMRHGLRWAIGLRHIRPQAHIGTIFTHGLLWALLVAVLHPSNFIVAAYLLAYFALRYAMAWMVGVRGLNDPVLRKNWWLIPVRDLLAYFQWQASFFFDRINWRGSEFYIRHGRLVPVEVAAQPAESFAKLGG